jgi:plasmid stabilization system protein ParE
MNKMNVIMTQKLYRLIYAPATREHLAAIDRRYHTLIRAHILERLTHQPEVITRNRKPLRQPAAFGAEWEIRFGPDNRFRVFYRVEEQNVIILAIGIKKGNRLIVGGKEVVL